MANDAENNEQLSINIQAIISEDFGKYKPEILTRLSEQKKNEVIGDIESAAQHLEIQHDSIFVHEAITDRALLPDDGAYENNGLEKYFIARNQILSDATQREMKRLDDIDGIFYHYFNARGITDETKNGFIAKTSQMIDERNPMINEILVGATDEPIIKEYRRRFRKYNVEFGRFGIGDWTVHALSLKVCPKNICELLLAEKTLPTSSYAHFEQNRKDAITLSEMGALPDRDIVHDQKPGCYEYICQILDQTDQENNPEASIILQRLERNTRPQGETKPDIKHKAELKPFVDNLSQSIKSANHWQKIGDNIKQLNDYIISKTAKYDMSPELIYMIEYFERQITLQLRNISKKDKKELFYDPTFKEMLRFRELIYSYDNYDEHRFEAFWRDFSNVEYEDEQGAIEKYQALSKHIGEQIFQLTKYFHAKHEDDLIGAIWSGNLNKELMNLS